MTWVQGSKVTRETMVHLGLPALVGHQGWEYSSQRVTRASQGSTDHREREESWSQGRRVNQDLTDPLGYLVYLGKMERSNLRLSRPDQYKGYLLL
eukprot:XP_013997928.1 PREDICTED: uncharacterized protein LOC106570291 isoform X2 [Salmo salar]